MNAPKRHEMGVDGICICPKCDTKTRHTAGIPCQDERCAKCGAKLIRQGSHHHELLLAKRGKKKRI